MTTTHEAQAREAILRQIAAHLEGFEYCAIEERTPRLAGPDGMAIFIGNARERGKLHIHGAWPMDGNQYMSPRSWGAVSYKDDQDISINVGAGREPEAIAREITRRFLPAYRELFAKCLARKAEYDGQRARAYQTACAVAQAVNLPAPPSDRRETQYALRVGSISTIGWYGDAVVYEKSVELKLHNIPAEQAIRVLQILYEAGCLSDSEQE